VIAGKSGGAPDAVVEGVTGVTVDGTDSADIARAAISILDDLDEAKAMGVRGREWVISNWGWEIWAKEFRKLLKVN
jgi:phosphatidylinositol alpha-1,6-mannosyltransferase